MKNPNLKYWLSKTPRPTVVLADDKRIEVPNNARGWKDLAATCAALEPTKLVALDKHGNIIRSIVLQSEEDDDEEKPAASPEMSDLQLFATLLSQAYKEGAQANQPLIQSAMSFVESQTTRLLRADTETERLRAHIHRLNLQIAELSAAPAAVGGGDEDGGIVGALVSGFVQGQARQQFVQAQPAAANGGKGKKAS